MGGAQKIQDSRADEINWLEHISGVWTEILAMFLQPHDVVVEVAPGGTDKIGRALANLNFRGTIYLIEPEAQALHSTFLRYKKLLPYAEIILCQETLATALPQLPARVDAVFANHPLDDMIIGKNMVDDEFSDFFCDHYNSPAEATRKAWASLSQNFRRLQKMTEEVIEDWRRLCLHANPSWLAISQYQSYFFQSNSIYLPDEQALEALNSIENFLDGNPIAMLKAVLQNRGEDPLRWLVRKRENLFVE